MKEYTAKITETSRELTARERIYMKDTNDATSLNELENGTILNIDNFVILEVHNERAESDKDYTLLVLLTTDGNKYTTSSDSFITSLIEINNELAEDNQELDTIKLVKRSSKNFAGKFLTCTLA